MTVKSKKKQAAKLAAQNKPIRPFKSQSTTLPSSSHPNDSETDSDDIPPEDLQITIDVLSILNDDPTPLSRKQYKPLKRAGWEFAKVLAAQGAGSGGTTQSQISHLLSLSLYQQALVLLFELYVTKTPTKLGSLQRWVRDCDATARPGEMLSPEDKEERRMVLRCLDMVLRVCDTSEKKITSLKGKEKAVEWEEAEDDGEEDEKEESYGEGIIRRMKVWDVRKQLESNPNPSHILQPSLPLWSLIQSGYDSTSTPKKSHPSFYPIQTTPGPLRRPPNLYPSTVHASLPSSPIPFPPTSSPIFSLTHPAIPTCSMILNVLPPTTCESIISICNDHLTWEPDQASSGSSAADKSSVLAHNVVWLADEKFVGELFERIKPFVKERIVGGEKGDGTGGRVRGINRRFRVYRYGPKQVYRPHIDGAWPAAGIDDKTGEYLHDSAPPTDPLWSRYTLLIYLNSDINPSTPASPTFIPGSTTFFLPSPTSIGTLSSYPIAPVQGAVLLFPHGDARGSLLHEGSPVREGGWKVVIRTDLLYEAEGFGEFAPGRAGKRKLVVDEGGGEEGGVSKVAKVQEGERMVGEMVVPRSLAEDNGGEGLEGVGG